MRWAFLGDWQIRGCTVVGRLYAASSAMAGFSRVRTGPDRLAGPVQKILAEDQMYYNHYAIEFAFKKATNLDTMAVVHFAISACK